METNPIKRLGNSTKIKQQNKSFIIISDQCPLEFPASTSEVSFMFNYWAPLKCLGELLGLFDHIYIHTYIRCGKKLNTHDTASYS